MAMRASYAKEVRLHKMACVANFSTVIVSIIIGVYLYTIGGFPWIMILPVCISGTGTYTNYKLYRVYKKLEDQSTNSVQPKGK